VTFAQGFVLFWRAGQSSDVRRSIAPLCALVLACAIALMPNVSRAQAYPVKPVRVIVPFPPGGALDFVARIAGDKLSAGLGQPVIPDNRPGAGGNIGLEAAARAKPDGYTLLAAASFLTINPSLYSKVGYDPITDFEPISLLSSYMLFVVVHPSLPVRSVKALIALARARPGQLDYASTGVGTTTHIAVELFAYMTGIRMSHIPYKGSGPALPATLSGQVPIQFNSPAIVPHVQAGKLVLIAVTGAKRSPTFPDAPTVAEAGVPGYEATAWNALFAPAGTPPAIIKRLNAEVVRGLAQPDAVEVLAKQGLDQAAGSPDALAALLRTEVPKWAKVIKVAKIKAE
jgi:tripartite-type tricarboxylate transporter receptor subunit TctC